MTTEKVDILIVGCGVAGCTAAIAAAESGKRILMITKTWDPMESNTKYAQGGIAVVGEDDSKDLLYRDIIKAGDGISNPEAVKIVVDEGPNLVYELLIGKAGVEFMKNEDGKYIFSKEAAHSRKRILHYYDMSGLEIQRKMLALVKEYKNITLLPGFTAIDLITTHHNSTNPLHQYQKNVCLGIYALENKTGVVHKFLADATILATGGIGKIYLYTTNPECATADGISMAYRAGAEIANMEYVQFHPTMFYSEEGGGFLITEAVRGEGGKLINKYGEEFMKRYSPEWADLAPRDEVTRAIYNELIRTESNYVYLDIAHYHEKGINIKERFPTIYKECLKHKIDIEKEPIPVVPAAHYFCGGILINKYAQSTLPGLYAVGESACSGLHGANRLASISLLEGLVYGNRAGKTAVNEESKKEYFDSVADWIYPKNTSKSYDDPILVIQDWNYLKSTMWNYVGIVRTFTRLDRAVSDLRNLRLRISDYYRNTNLTRAKVELRNGVIVGNLIAQYARRNTKTLGCHYIESK